MSVDVDSVLCCAEAWTNFLPDLLNYLDAPTPPTSINHPTLTVQSLSALWEDERRRRRHLGLSATPSPLPASVRHSLEPLSLEVDIYERLRRIAKADLPASIGAIANPPSSDSSVSHSDGEMIRALQSMFEPSLQLTQSHAPAANDALLVSRQPLSGSAPAATDGSKDNAEAVVNREIAQTQVRDHFWRPIIDVDLRRSIHLMTRCWAFWNGCSMAAKMSPLGETLKKN